MRPGYSKTRLHALVGACFALALFVSTDARADFLTDVENVVDATGELPFKFSDWRPIIAACDPEGVARKVENIYPGGAVLDSYVIHERHDQWDILFPEGSSVGAISGETSRCRVWPAAATRH